MSDLTKNEKLDFQKFFVESGEPGFNPARNKAVVEETIRKTEKRMEEKKRHYDEKLAERVEAAASYASYLDSHPGDPAFYDPEKYFGRNLLAELRAKDITSEIQAKMLARRRGLEGAISVN